MLSALVPFQSPRITKSFIADITFVRPLVRVNTHVGLQTTRLTKTLLAHITFVRFLVRVNTHVSFQTTRLSKTLSQKLHSYIFFVCEYACAFSNVEID